MGGGGEGAETIVCMYVTYGYPSGTVKIGFLESKMRKITSQIAKSVAKKKKKLF